MEYEYTGVVGVTAPVQIVEAVPPAVKLLVTVIDALLVEEEDAVTTTV